MCETIPDPPPGMADAAVAWRKNIPDPPPGLPADKAGAWRETWFREHPPPPPPGSTEDEAAKWRETWFLTHPPPGMDQQQLCGWRKAHTRKGDPSKPIRYENVGALGQARGGGGIVPKFRAHGEPLEKDVCRWIEKEMRRVLDLTGSPMTEDEAVDFAVRMYGVTATSARKVVRHKISDELKNKAGRRRFREEY
jgi:hypothetical protein